MTESPERFSFLLRVLRACQDSGLKPSRTQLQKLVYFLERSKAGVGYTFKLHYYGPYSDLLASDIAYLTSIGHVKAIPEPSGYGYRYTLPSEAPDDSAGPAGSRGKVIADVVQELRELSVRDLGLLATLDFVRQALSQERKEPAREVVFSAVCGLKPWAKEAPLGELLSKLKALKLA